MQVKLRDSLVSALQFSQTRDAEIAWVDGQLVRENIKSLAQGSNDVDKMDVDSFDSVPVLEQLALTEVSSEFILYIHVYYIILLI